MTTMAINTKMTVSELRWNLKQQLNRFSLNFRAKAVYRYLADKVTIDGVCWPSIATITDDCSLSRRTVIRATRDLEDGRKVEKPSRKTSGSPSCSAPQEWKQTVSPTVRGGCNWRVCFRSLRTTSTSANWVPVPRASRTFIRKSRQTPYWFQVDRPRWQTSSTICPQNRSDLWGFGIVWPLTRWRASLSRTKTAFRL